MIFLFSRWFRVSSVVRSLLFLRNHEVDVALRLALFVIFARTNLRALLGFTILVLQAPVADLEVASSGVVFLLIALAPVQLLMLIVHPG